MFSCTGYHGRSCRQKLGKKKCYIIDSKLADDEGPKDANDALKRNLDMMTYFKQSKTLGDKKMLQVSDMK